MIPAGYASQEEGRELVGFGQGTDPDWSWSGEGAPVARDRADRLTSASAGREVPTFHTPGGFTTGNPRQVKWATLRARLTRSPSGGMALLVSSANPGPLAASRAAIDRFLAAAGGSNALLPR